MKVRDYYVYITASVSRVLYIGVTNDLERRLFEHRQADQTSFTGRYHVNRLVYVEAFASPRDAIVREKQIKRWGREKKTALIEHANPEWRDLSDGWNE
jgi:putative endonuclease